MQFLPLLCRFFCCTHAPSSSGFTAWLGIRHWQPCFTVSLVRKKVKSVASICRYELLIRTNRASPQHSYYTGAKRLQWLMLGWDFFKQLQQILCFSVLDFAWFPVSQLICERRFRLLKTIFKDTVWFQQNLSAICLLMSEPKPSSPTQIYIYPSCLELAGPVMHPAPTTANGSAVGSQVRC